MSNQPRLSDLCSTCSANKSKYRCPGCATRTCSLPCYKRHQQRAQCSGLRDPTKFVRKSQLATPAGIDHDFNFLTNVERSLERTERTLNALCATTRLAPETGNRARQIHYGRLETYADVTIIRAPNGFSRQKENQSHPSSSKKSKHNVVWTVEWISADDVKRRVLTQTSSTLSVGAANPLRENNGKKRKLDATESKETSDTNNHQPVSLSRTHPIKHLDTFEEDVSLDVSINKPQSEHSPFKCTSSPRASSATAGIKGGEGERGKELEDAHPARLHHDEQVMELTRSPQCRLFLLKPRTSSSRRVVSPLDPEATLGECLRGQTMLEFPTIFSLPDSAATLPEDFILEEDHVKLESDQQKEFDELINELDPDILKRLEEDGKSRGGDEEEVDAKKMLDVLKRDLGGSI